MNPEFEAAAIVAAVSEDVQAYEMQDAPYIVLWIMGTQDIPAMLHAIAHALVPATDRVAHAIQDALYSARAVQSIDLVGMVRALREGSHKRKDFPAGDAPAAQRQRVV